MAAQTAHVQLNLAEWQAGFERAIEQQRDHVERDLTKLGLKVTSNAKRACPVDTGRLRASIAFDVTRSGDKLILKVGTNVSYAAYVEFGTRYTVPQPFLRPAFLAVRGSIG